MSLQAQYCMYDWTSARYEGSHYSKVLKKSLAVVFMDLLLKQMKHLFSYKLIYYGSMID
jgi:hypothetical protein